jgi:hypothetical protein
MNEKLKELVLNIIAAKSHDEQQLARLIQQYADEQALGFAKWCNDNHFTPSTDGLMWSRIHEEYFKESYVLTRYHESQKP